jgi:glycosyltransferase involved in cell wall biosynthesis
MPQNPTFSLIVPTRQRTDKLRRLLHSIAVTASNPEALEVVLVVDVDDAPSQAFAFDGLTVRHVVVRPGLPMGALNMAGYEACTGAYVMLLNDDVIARTRRWDRRVLAAVRRFPDGIVLVHTNDNLFRRQLCTFPIVSRSFCEIAGSICPPDYLRYRIDDHIEDIFSLLWKLGECRAVYQADVIFEHLKYIEEDGRRTYVPEEAALTHDGPLFLALFPQRKELALRLKARIVGHVTPGRVQRWRAFLDAIDDPFTLRVPERHHLEGQPLGSRISTALRRLVRI